jgi:hypothetical protein
MGQGIIYAVKQDGTLLWYQHTGYATGDATWSGPLEVGSDWQHFSKIIPAGAGVILAIKPDGSLLWYRHDNYLVGISTTFSRFGVDLGPIWEESDGPIGSGWTGFREVVALLPQSILQGPN